MTRLVADIGGTNARLALAQGHEVLPGTQQRFRNDAHSGFDEVAELYLADHSDHRVTEIVAAIAGPVSPEEGRLTNRGWVLRTGDLCWRFGVDRAVLVNDLAALGHALPGGKVDYFVGITFKIEQLGVLDFGIEDQLPSALANSALDVAERQEDRIPNRV